MSLELTNSQYKLEDICLQITDGKHGDCENQENSGYYFVSVKDIGDGIIDYSNARQITKSDFEDTDKRTKLENEDILITNSGTIGKFVFVNSPLSRKTTFQKSVAIIKPNKNKIIPKFLYYYLNSEKRRLIEYAGGTTQKNLLLRDIRNFEVDVPNESQQKKIIEILNNIDQLISVNKKLNKNLTKLSSIIFINLLEKSNNFLELNRCCKFIKGKKPKKTSDYPQSNFLDYLTIDVLSNQSQTYAYDDKGILANEYDILMVMDGASSGKLFYGKSGLVGSTLAKLNVEEKYLEIVYQFLKQSEKFISDNTTGSAIPHTDKGLVLSLKCPISEELLNYSDMFKSIRSSIITNNNEILKLQKLRDTLLPKLMSGEIDVSKINCDLKIIIIKFILNPLKYIWRHLNENKDYIQNTKSNEALFESRTIYKIDKFFIKFTSRYRYYRQ